MSVHLAAFASEMTKISESDDKKSSYARQIAAAAPYAALTALADVPKGYVDKYIEQTVKQLPKAQQESAGRAALGRGAGRLAGGLATAPVFLSGVRDLRSDDKERRKRGYAKVIGSGIVFSALKGGVEGGILGAGKGKEVALKKIKGIAGARGIVGLGAGALTAKNVASATSEKGPGKKKSLLKQYALPVAIGGAVGAGEGAFEEAYTKGLKNVTRRGLLGAAAGRGTAAALGTAVLASLVKKFAPSGKSESVKGKPGYRLAPSKKDPQVKRWQKVASASSPPEIKPNMYSDVRGWSKGQDSKDVFELLKAINEEGQGERSASRRAANYALRDELTARGHRVPPAPQRREVERRSAPPGKVPIPNLIPVLAAGAAPALAALAIETLPPDDRERLLNDAIDRLWIQNRMHRVKGPNLAVPSGMPKEVASRYRTTSGKPVPPNSPVISLPDNQRARAAIMAHEVGHMEAGFLRRKLLQNRTALQAGRVGRVVAGALPVVAILSAGDASGYATKQELESRAKFLTAMGTVTAAMQAPSIAEEALANVKATSVLKSVGDQKVISRMVRHAGPGFLSYLAPAVVPFAVAAAFRSAAKRAEK